MLKVATADYVGGYKIRIRFSDGREGVVDLEDALWGPMFEPLRAPEVFAAFEVSDLLHTIRWPNDADLAPEYLLDAMVRQSVAQASQTDQ